MTGIEDRPVNDGAVPKAFGGAKDDFNSERSPQGGPEAEARDGPHPIDARIGVPAA